MIKHLRLLELYLTTAFDIEKARMELRSLYYRFLFVAELAFLLVTTPMAFIAINGLLAWLIIVSIHLIPRWKECGYKLRYYFFPLLVLMAVTGVLLPLISPVTARMFENFVAIVKKPALIIAFAVTAFIAYGLHNSETENTPKISLAKRILYLLLLIFVLFFSIPNPLRSYIVNTLL